MEAATIEKQTALTPVHIELGAKMAPFAGYLMPITYKGINEEHNTVRTGVGVFDVSHMGEFIYKKGEHTLGLIQKVSSNDAGKLSPGQAQYSCMPNEEGGIVDDLLIYHLEDGAYMLVVNAANIEKDWDWIERHNDENVESHNVTDKTTLLAVQGPKAIDTLQKLTDYDLASLKYYTFTKTTLAGIENVLISATGYTGSGGFELYFENGNARHIWDAIFSAGEEFDIQPIGLAARDTLRLEMGYALYGNDIDDTTNPYEAGLGWITRLDKDFTGKETIVKQKEAGIKRKLVGFEMIDKGIPRHGYEITDGASAIGKVTSGTMGPSVGKAIGMGYVPKEMAEEGKEIFINVRDKHLKAKIVKPPFYRESSLKK